MLFRGCLAARAMVVCPMLGAGALLSRARRRRDEPIGMDGGCDDGVRGRVTLCTSGVLEARGFSWGSRSVGGLGYVDSARCGVVCRRKIFKSC